MMGRTNIPPRAGCGFVGLWAATQVETLPGKAYVELAKVLHGVRDHAKSNREELDWYSYPGCTYKSKRIKEILMDQAKGYHVREFIEAKYRDELRCKLGPPRANWIKDTGIQRTIMKFCNTTQES